MLDEQDIMPLPGIRVVCPTEDRLDMVSVCRLLQERGYDVTYRFEHVHASREQREFHVCLLSDLASLSQQGFLRLLEEALKPRVEEPGVLKHRSGKGETRC